MQPNISSSPTDEPQRTEGELVPMGQLLDTVSDFFLRFVVLSRAQANTTALWTAHTYAFEAADTTPYLHITSPEKRSGKTRLLETLDLLVNKPWLTGRVTPAVLARKIDKEKPTLLLDESDAAFNGDKEYSETLRGILNTGHRRGGKASVCTGQGANIGFKDLSTFCPKAVAGIGKLPDTVADRSIPIVLKRRKSSEPIERFRRKNVEKEAERLRESLATMTTNLRLHDAEPELPQELDDRAADSWEPLLAIADSLGNNWPQKARSAAIELSCGVVKEDQSLGSRLLTDIKAIFDGMGVDRLSSAELVQALNAIEESPWAEIDHRPLTANKMARLLKPYGVVPKNIRTGATVPKGYEKEQFTDVWNRYAPALPCVSTATSATLATNYSQTETATNNENQQNVADRVQSPVVLDVAGVAVVDQEEAPETTSFDEDSAPAEETCNDPDLALEPWEKEAGVKKCRLADGTIECQISLMI